ncbi:MAG: cobalamin biosynthesis protein CobG [Rhodobacteraceae bacterium]|nr:cobalamin biosynthesis protein CobG [Paracoccaceae bacterium]
MSDFTVKGWCPGAYRPMRSGDGLIVRIRPRLARLSAKQTLGLCDAAKTHASGVIDVTNRANLQLRGVREDAHDTLLIQLDALGLLDATQAIEARRNILTAPMWMPADDSHTLTLKLISRLRELPDLPAKFGFAVDAGDRPALDNASADIRIERAQNGSLIIRADGAETGCWTDKTKAINDVITLAHWFAATRAPETKRMARHLRLVPLPDSWQGTLPAVSDANINLTLLPGPSAKGLVLGAAYGSIPAQALAQAMWDSKATGLILTPWRLFILEGVFLDFEHPFITDPNDPLLSTDACPGAPFCASSSVDTRQIASALNRPNLHVSGCTKGCARPHASPLTLVGNQGRFDLVRDGCSWDEPIARGLTPDDLLKGHDL